ncbi:hypothetical protein MicloDRAFT_00002710 [Microvirga lotononidis]|uniref:Nodulation protein NopA n=1 Tax=Microvirga lotononidis TaxID=864069 RepID=I4Z448_9HYPH|nr:hypothetical protein MicloDRAFT_00002710 [Microvirga lotononidis]
MSKVGRGNGGGGNNTISTSGSKETSSSGAAAFQGQLKELAKVSAEATSRSMDLRVLTTQLTTIKKVADERVS